MSESISSSRSKSLANMSIVSKICYGYLLILSLVTFFLSFRIAFHFMIFLYSLVGMIVAAYQIQKRLNPKVSTDEQSRFLSDNN